MGTFPYVFFFVPCFSNSFYVPWKDTAGQERFSSLSTALFRGADAAILMFDVNDPSTMVATKKWWADFCDKSPVADDDVMEFCCVLVGNKIDMDGGWSVSESDALHFMDTLLAPQEGNVKVTPPEPSSVQVDESLVDPAPIAIIPKFAHSREPSHSPNHHLSKSSRSRSSSRFYAGTMTSTHTALTIFHTPSSSVFDRGSASVYQSARSSPEPWSQSEPDLPRTNSPQKRRRTVTMLSRESTGSDSVVTMTPSLFAREREQNRDENSNGLPLSHSSPDLSLNQSKYRTPLPPDRGPRLFFTSAKTGEGVNDVFEYIARRVVKKWDYDDWLDARRMHFRDPTLSDGETLGRSESLSVRLDRRMGRESRAGCC